MLRYQLTVLALLLAPHRGLEIEYGSGIRFKNRNLNFILLHVLQKFNLKFNFPVCLDSSSLEQWSPVGSLGVGVKQVKGCTKGADYITLSSHQILSEKDQNPAQEQDQLERIGEYSYRRYSSFDVKTRIIE